jgi:hypothetical protein
VSHRRMNLARMIALMMKDWTEPKRARSDLMYARVEGRQLKILRYRRAP